PPSACGRSASTARRRRRSTGPTAPGSGRCRARARAWPTSRSTRCTGRPPTGWPELSTREPPVPAGLSVTVITRDEAADLEACLASVAWGDELVVVDAESTDRTV